MRDPNASDNYIEPYDPVEFISLAEHSTELSAAKRGGELPAAGRLMGLPVLSEDGVWVDSAGAASLTGLSPNTSTAYLARRQPTTFPIPAAHQFPRRNYWPAETALT